MQRASCHGVGRGYAGIVACGDPGTVDDPELTLKPAQQRSSVLAVVSGGGEGYEGYGIQSHGHLPGPTARSWSGVVGSIQRQDRSGTGLPTVQPCGRRVASMTAPSPARADHDGAYAEGVASGAAL